MGLWLTLMHMSNRSGQSFFCGPAIAKTLANCFNSNPCSAGPLRNDKIFSIKRYKHIVASIRLLLFHRRPSAISRFVITERVWKTVNRMFVRWPFPHVGQEIFKRLPSVANRNAFSAIFTEDQKIWIFASLANVNPCVVFGRIGQPMSSIAVNANLTVNVNV